MHNVLGIVDQMVDLPFQDRLKVKLHLTAGHLDIDTQWQGVTLLEILHILTNNLHLAIIDLIHLGHLAQLSALGLATAHLEEEIVLADPLAFKCRTIGQRDIYLANSHLEAPDLNGFLGDFIMWHIGYNMLIGTDAGGQYLWNIRISNGRKAPVNSTCRVGRPFRIYIA